MNSFVHHQSRHQSRDNLVTDENRHNCTGNTDNFVSFRLQNATQVIMIFCNFFTSVSALLVAKNIKLGQGSSRLGRVDTACVRVRATHVSNHLQHTSVLHADEADVGRQAFAARSAEDHI